MSEPTPDLEALLVRLRSYATLLCSAFTVEEMDALLQEIEREETLMPFFDPTAYMKLQGNMRDHKVVIRALRDCRRTLETLRPKVPA